MQPSPRNRNSNGRTITKPKTGTVKRVVRRFHYLKASKIPVPVLKEDRRIGRMGR